MQIVGPIAVLAWLAVFAAAAPAAGAAPERVLFFTLSAGFRHEVIPLAQGTIRQMAAQSGAFAEETSEDVGIFAPDRLRRFSVIIFFTSGELPMNAAQKAAFLAFVRGGKGFVGIHSATDTFYQWPGYLELIGGYFNDHPWHQKVRIAVADPASPLVSFLAPAFEIDDEIYQISDFDFRTCHVLLRLDPSSVDLNRPTVHPRFYGWPLAWTRGYGRGRVFYLALGHEEKVWRDPRYQRLLLEGLLWTMRGKAGG
jgi:hypothetical protein